MLQSYTDPPSTPPRKARIRAAAGGPFTPKSTRTHRREFELYTPQQSPFISPKLARRNAKDAIYASHAETNAFSHILPTPLTVGTGRRAKCAPFPIVPSAKSKSLTASLRAVSDEPDMALQASPVLEQELPVTPPPKVVLEQKPQFESAFDSDDDVQVVSVDLLKNIPRYRMKNPFVGGVPAFNLPPPKNSIDLSTHMELINHRTGERKIETLTEEQRRFKPKKLVFAQDAKPLAKVNYNIANKFIGKNIGKKFTIEESACKNLPGFNIFSDEEGE